VASMAFLIGLVGSGGAKAVPTDDETFLIAEVVKKIEEQLITTQNQPVSGKEYKISKVEIILRVVQKKNTDSSLKLLVAGTKTKGKEKTAQVKLSFKDLPAGLQAPSAPEELD